MYFIVERRTVAGYFSLSMGVLRESFALVIVEVMDDDGFALHQSRKGGKCTATIRARIR